MSTWKNHTSSSECILVLGVDASSGSTVPTSRHGNITHRELVGSGGAGGLEQHRRSGASPELAVRDRCRGVENSQGTTRSGGRESRVTDEHDVYQSEVGAFVFATAANQQGSEVLLTNTFRRGSREREYSSGGRVRRVQPACARVCTSRCSRVQSGTLGTHPALAMPVQRQLAISRVN